MSRLSLQVLQEREAGFQLGTSLDESSIGVVLDETGHVELRQMNVIQFYRGARATDGFVRAGFRDAFRQLAHGGRTARPPEVPEDDSPPFVCQGGEDGGVVTVTVFGHRPTSYSPESRLL